MMKNNYGKLFFILFAFMMVTLLAYWIIQGNGAEVIGWAG